jgi:hypothetical protein
MTADASGVALASILDALTLVQGQLVALTEASIRIEATQKAVLTRLDTIDAGQAAVTDLLPVLEMILARSIEDRELMKTHFSTIAAAVGFAHAAASGNPAPLPTDVLSDPMLERFVLAQPADTASNSRALIDWRRAAAAAATTELISILGRQYEPSPTDTPETRILRYQLAAITREQIKGREAVPPAAPETTFATVRSTEAKGVRSDELARLWRAGEGAALYAEPEVAGALDLFVAATQRGERIGEAQLQAELAALHGSIGERLEAGGRPSMADAAFDHADCRLLGDVPDQHR